MKLRILHQKNITLFLGAGASAPFDYAPTKPFLQKFRAGSSQTDGKFVDDLFSMKHVDDIEHIIEILDSIIEFNPQLNKYPIKQLLQRFPLSFQFGRRITFQSTGRKSIRTDRRRSWTEVFSLSKNLKEAVEEKLFDEYESNPDMYEKIKEVYTPFFYVIEKHSADHTLDVFTANFDTVIEDYLRETDRYTLVDGFLSSEWHRSSALKQFSRKGNSAKRLLRLYKLHGSISWKQRFDKTIMKVLFHKKIKSSRIWKKNIVIYPASKQVPSEEPFITLYELFRKRIRSRSDVCIAIGFSFRDEYIDKIIADWLTRAETSKLVILSKAASTAKQNLLEREKRLKKLEAERIIALKGEFGKKETVEKIDQCLWEI